jgi:hypothetical protein
VSEPAETARLPPTIFTIKICSKQPSLLTTLTLNFPLREIIHFWLDILLLVFRFPCGKTCIVKITIVSSITRPYFSAIGDNCYWGKCFVFLFVNNLMISWSFSVPFFLLNFSAELVTALGWPNWVIFRLLGDCLHTLGRFWGNSRSRQNFKITFPR